MSPVRRPCIAFGLYFVEPVNVDLSCLTAEMIQIFFLSGILTAISPFLITVTQYGLREPVDVSEQYLKSREATTVPSSLANIQYPSSLRVSIRTKSSLGR